MKQIADAIKNANNIAILTHVNPDGDAVGSSLALTYALRRMGKHATAVYLREIPQKYAFLCVDASCVTIYSAQTSVPKYDSVIAVDCADRKRLGEAEALFLSAKTTISIDHHTTNPGYADVNLVLPRAATGEIILDLIENLGVDYGREIANCLYAAIVTDTGRFSYQDTGRDTFLKAAALCSHGLQIPYVCQQIYASRSFASTQLIKTIISNISLHAGGRVAVTSISLQELSALGVSAEECESAIDYAREIQGVEIAVFIREMDTEYYKVSLRSKSEVDVAQIAAGFGGGGHVKAAGCALHGEYFDVLECVLRAVEESLA